MFVRRKAQMWEPIAKELALPWPMVEAIYWQLRREGPTVLRNTERKGQRKSRNLKVSQKELKSLPQIPLGSRSGDKYRTTDDPVNDSLEERDPEGLDWQALLGGEHGY